MEAPDPDVYIPNRVFQCKGEVLRAARKFAMQLSEVAYVRIVDKGPGLLWGFCKRFIWDSLVEFMIAEGYMRDSCSAKQYTKKMRDLVGKRG